MSNPLATKPLFLDDGGNVLEGEPIAQMFELGVFLRRSRNPKRFTILLGIKPIGLIEDTGVGWKEQGGDQAYEKPEDVARAIMKRKGYISPIEIVKE